MRKAPSGHSSIEARARPSTSASPRGRVASRPCCLEAAAAPGPRPLHDRTPPVGSREVRGAAEGAGQRRTDEPGSDPVPETRASTDSTPAIPNWALLATVSILSMVAALLWVVIPGDPPATVVSNRGAATYTGRDRLIGAAGDIVCDPANRFFGVRPPVTGNCHADATAASLKRADVDRVLALGDNQYEAATLAEYRALDARSWGPLKSITYPVAGNHEYYTRREWLLPVLRQGRRQTQARLVQLRRRRMAPRGAQLELQRRGLLRRIRPGEVVARRP